MFYQFRFRFEFWKITSQVSQELFLWPTSNASSSLEVNITPLAKSPAAPTSHDNFEDVSRTVIRCVKNSLQHSHWDCFHGLMFGLCSWSLPHLFYDQSPMDGVLMDDPPANYLAHSGWLNEVTEAGLSIGVAFDQLYLHWVWMAVVMLLNWTAYYAHLHIHATNYDGPVMCWPFVVALHNAFVLVFVSRLLSQSATRRRNIGHKFNACENLIQRHLFINNF